MAIKDNINSFFREYKRGILISWIILGFYIIIDRLVKMQIYPVFDWQSLIVNTAIVIFIILLFSALSSYLVRDVETTGQSSYGFFDNNLYWIVPLIYLLLGIILRLAYTNSFDQEFLDKLLETPLIGWVISLFQ